MTEVNAWSVPVQESTSSSASTASRSRRGEAGSGSGSRAAKCRRPPSSTTIWEFAGTLGNSLHSLDALLNLDGGVKPEMPGVETGTYGPLEVLARNRANLKPGGHALAGHAAGDRLPGHPPGPRL